jgi:hemerythrin superfamily protein
VASKKAKSTATRAGKRSDALTMLKADHEKVRGLLSALEKSKSNNPGRRTKLVHDIGSEVRTHAAIEEEVFYPAFKAAAETKDDAKLYFEAIEEHGVVHTVLPEIEGMNPGSERFAAKAKVLKDLIEHHAEEEEDELFPRARKILSKEDLTALAEQMQTLKNEFKANPFRLEQRTPAARLH